MYFVLFTLFVGIIVFSYFLCGETNDGNDILLSLYRQFHEDFNTFYMPFFTS